jgi:serine/threonine-protein kinase
VNSTVPAPGEIIAAKYEVERVLGEGGMGVVLAARHVQLGRRVAIKFMRGQAAQEASAVSRFLREARAAVALSSDHVAKVIDVGTLEKGEPYIVMEYLAGVDLGHVLRTRGPLAVPEAVSAVLQACEAIAEAHMLGIVHRDLKPSNLFMTTRRDGSQLVKVLDFGISKTVDFNTAPGAGENLTASGLLMGSPGYMSPEQLRSAKAVDGRTDIWSLGVILYELLIGEPPFTGDTLGETFARIITDDPTPIRQRRPEVPEALAAVIMKCLERGIERRIQTVGELATKLAPFASREEALSAERIARMSAAGVGVVAAVESRSASNTMTATPVRISTGDSPRAQMVETGPAWLKSGSFVPSVRSPFRGVAAAAAAALGGVALLAAFIGFYQFGRKPVDRAVGSTAVVAAPSPSASAVPRGEAAGTAPPVAASVEEATVTEFADAGAALPPRWVPPQTPQRGEIRHTAPSRPAAKSVGGREPGLDDLLQQRQ